MTRLSVIIFCTNEVSEVAAIPKGTRNKIVQVLKRNQGLSSTEIGEQLGLHKVTVRQHLDVLENNGYVDYTKERGSRGRPRNVYHLTEKAINQLFPRNYPGFAVSLLDAVAATDGEKKVHSLLRQQMEQRAANYFQGQKYDSLGEKVEALADFFNREGHMVEVEETRSAFVFREYHCALINIAEKYGQLCQIELSFFQNILGLPIQRECHIASGDSLCSYHIPKMNIIN